MRCVLIKHKPTSLGSVGLSSLWGGSCPEFDFPTSARLGHAKQITLPTSSGLGPTQNKLSRKRKAQIKRQGSLPSITWQQIKIPMIMISTVMIQGSLIKTCNQPLDSLTGRSNMNRDEIDWLKWSSNYSFPFLYVSRFLNPRQTPSRLSGNNEVLVGLRLQIAVPECSS